MAEGMTFLNLILLGRTGAGKSASGNTILGRLAFISKKSCRSVTGDVAVESGTVWGFPVTVYDTPGLFNTHMREEEIQQMINEKVLQRYGSGLCVSLLVIKADSFTEEERKTVEKIEELLGEERLEKTWILFTRGDELEEENTTIQEFINDTEPLKKLVQKYDQRYHVFNNKSRGHTGQVKMLLVKILKPYIDIKGEFEDAQRFRREEEERRWREERKQILERRIQRLEEMRIRQEQKSFWGKVGAITGAVIAAPFVAVAAVVVLPVVGGVAAAAAGAAAGAVAGSAVVAGGAVGEAVGEAVGVLDAIRKEKERKQQEKKK